jgi:hypothetical protein
MITDYFVDEAAAKVYMEFAKKQEFEKPYKVVAALLFIDADTENLDALKVTEEILPNMVTINDGHLTRSFQVLDSKDADKLVFNCIQQLKEEYEDSMVIEPANLRPYIKVDWVSYFSDFELDHVLNGAYHLNIDYNHFYLTPLD